MLRRVLVGIEILTLTVLLLGTRCANYQDVFVGGNVYFTDADCYARMTRVRICADHPGTIVRHHDFENFPTGTAPHTTAPLDYLIVGLSILLKPFAAQPIDLAGAIVSPLLALIGGWFLWWWSRRMNFGYRWAGLILYAISPILVHGTELGRPDHQSLLMALIPIAICAEWSLEQDPSKKWSLTSGIAWGLALWVCFYEPPILLLVILVFGVIKDRHLLFRRDRWIGRIVFGFVIAAALLVEQRVPSFSIVGSNAKFENWSRSIGELARVPVFNRIWFVWAGYCILLAPVLIGLSLRKRTSPPIFVLILFAATFLLTIWQARWGYFCLTIFVIALPGLLAPIKSQAAVWVAFALSTFPILQYWDARLWPNESDPANRIERRKEATGLRQLALAIRSADKQPFLAPWWLSPSISYWSGQPGVAGSSHEALNGTLDTANFFITEDPGISRGILQKHHAAWVFALDWDRIGPNSTDLTGIAPGERSIGRILDRSPGLAPRFLVLSSQNSTAKLFRFVDKF